MTRSDLVLHTLRCIGFAGLPRISEATGLPEPDVESDLIDLAVAGLVTHHPGDFGGWGLTDAGRIADAERTAHELKATGVRKTIANVYDDFLVLNPEMLDLCAAWQSRTVEGVSTLNDHTDLAYDSRVLNWLTDFDQRADLVLASLATALPRFRHYRTRLTNALTQVNSGALEYVTDGTASYHTVWFQLHEDLLATLGIPRDQ